MGKDVVISMHKTLSPRMHCNQNDIIPSELEKRLKKVFSKIPEIDFLQMYFIGRDNKGIIAKIESLIKKLEKGTAE